ncbi:Hypothetical predicted protein [Podarcis lilfordi]|uniref:Secreted protein n=1 Tax=Podarcis lilfordi TaxID=74358 RepID=A0AA35KLB7_9SAUR|nr:Hypothetical predicted protein [Podarcis lilfordi]
MFNVLNFYFSYCLFLLLGGEEPTAWGLRMALQSGLVFGPFPGPTPFPRQHPSLISPGIFLPHWNVSLNSARMGEVGGGICRNWPAVQLHLLLPPSLAPSTVVCGPQKAAPKER